MANNKQWLPNKTSGIKIPRITYPFDGMVSSTSTNSNSLKFQFTSPGLINGKIPDNMFNSDGSFYSVNIPSSANARWYIIANCNFDFGLISADIRLSTSPPEIISPVKNVVPSKAEIILYHGYGPSIFKAVKGNVLVKPMLVFRAFKEDPQCGQNPVDEYYTMVSIS